MFGGALTFLNALATAIAFELCSLTRRASAAADGTPPFVMMRTAPFIPGWISQTYRNKPAFVKRTTIGLGLSRARRAALDLLVPFVTTVFPSLPGPKTFGLELISGWLLNQKSTPASSLTPAIVLPVGTKGAVALPERPRKWTLW